MLKYKRILLLYLIINLCLRTSLMWSKFSNPPYFDHKVDLPTERPLIIAHRGSSGVLPEHTVEAYTEAVRQGADVIECDVCVTKDLKLLCLHESWMTSTNTNVDEVFPDKLTTKYVQDEGENYTGYFSVDFTLDEIKQIRVKQRFHFRDQRHNGQYKIPTLQEYIEVAQAPGGRKIGIYPETKDPEWVNSLDIMQYTNTTFEQLLVEELARYGYTKPTDPCFVQSFSEKSLQRLRELTQLPLIMLANKEDQLMTDEKLKELSRFCYGIGPHTAHIVEVSDGYIVNTTDYVSRVHKAGLKIHPYTFRNEDQYLAVDYHGDPYEQLRKFLDLGIDGYFCDFPETLFTFLDVTYDDCDHGKYQADKSSFSACSSVLCLTICFVLMAALLYQ